MTDEEEIRILDLCQEFFDKVKLARCDELHTLGVEMDTMCGLFFTLEKAEKVVRAFPRFHVFTGTDTRLYNRIVEDASFFYLGEGDRDPTLTCQRSKPTPSNWGRALKSAVDRYGSNPEDPEDRFYINILRVFAGGHDMKDPSFVRKALDERQDQ